MTTTTNTIETLNRKFNSLNKKYIKLDNTWNEITTEDGQILLSQNLEDIQVEMSKISTEIENLES